MKMAGCTAFIISGDHSDVEVAYAFHTRGGAHAQRGEGESALPDFTTSVELDPTIAAAFSTRGASYLNEKNLAPPIPHLNHALNLSPLPTHPHNNRHPPS